MNEIGQPKNRIMHDDLDSDDISSHENVLELMEEIKKFEEKYQRFDVKPRYDFAGLKTDDSSSETLLKQKITFLSKIKKLLKAGDNTLDLQLEPDNLRNQDNEIENGTLKKRFKHPSVGFRKKSVPKRVDSKPVVPTTFKVGFNEDGELVNLDLKKKIKKEKTGRKGFLKIFLKKNKDKESKDSGDDSKASKIKGIFGKFGKIKDAIPFKKK